MGNSATKEQRSPTFRPAQSSRSYSPQEQPPASPSNSHPSSGGPHQVYNSRQGRSSRSELSALLGLGSNNERETAGPEMRRETKAEREARKLEKERIARAKERERSMREESVDGGFLVTQGVYTGTEDYNKAVVRQLMIERRLAPFWRGLNEHSDSWTEHQLVSVARGLPLPAADEIPLEEPQREQSNTEPLKNVSDQHLNNLTVPISSRTQSFNSDSSTNLSPSQPSFFLPPSSQASGSTLLRGRAKTLASLTTSSKNMPQVELQPREIQLPKDPYVNGQPLEAYLYKDASECPICFLYYPPYLNRTRCCDQSICSECFVQIKRPDPHPPEHPDPSAAPRPPDESVTESNATLVSEPAACPFCVQPEFGVTFDSPPIRRGLVYANHASNHPLSKPNAAMSSSSSVASIPTSGQMSPQSANRRRTTSLSANAPSVITTDRVRPDWATKLASARAHAARRAAAATALHTAAYLMNNRNDSPDSRGFGGFGRRSVLRRGTGGDSPSSGTSSSNLAMLALMSERYATSGSGANGSSGQTASAGDAAPSISGPPRQSSRRNRIDDLEEMMIMEAIRLSLATEEERRRREEKESKKEAKKKAKEEKKSEKSSRRGTMYSSSANPSSGALDSTASGPIPMDSSKGKSIAREDVGGLSDLGLPLSRSAPHLESGREAGQLHMERNRAHGFPVENNVSFGLPAAPYRPSHLRTLSNASSSSSSIADFVPGGMPGGSHSSLDGSPNSSGLHLSAADQDSTVSAMPTAGGAGTEPMFNFRSLAAMIDEDNVKEDSKFVEHTEITQPSSLEQTGERSTSALSQEREQMSAPLDMDHDPPMIQGQSSRPQEHSLPVANEANDYEVTDFLDTAGEASAPRTDSQRKVEEIKAIGAEADRPPREAGSV